MNNEKTIGKMDADMIKALPEELLDKVAGGKVFTELLESEATCKFCGGPYVLVFDVYDPYHEYGKDGPALTKHYYCKKCDIWYQ